MGFNIHRIGWIKPSLLVHRLGQRRLGICIRELDALRPAVLVDTRVDNDGLDGVVVLDGLVQPFEDDGGSALAAAVAVTPVVKDVALTVGVHHSGRVRNRLHSGSW